MDSFSSLISQVDVAGKATDEEVEKTKTLLSIYGGMLRTVLRCLLQIERGRNTRDRHLVRYILPTHKERHPLSCGQPLACSYS